MVRLAKRSFALLLAVLMVVISSATAFAAGSPTQGGEEATAEKGSTVTVEESGEATIDEYRETEDEHLSFTKATVDGKTYPVTTIGSNALANNQQATSVTLGKNVTTVEAKALATANLKKVIIKVSPKKLSKMTIAKNAIGKKVKTVYVSKKTTATQLKAFKKLLKKAGYKGVVKLAKTF